MNNKVCEIKCGFQDKQGMCGYHMPDTMRECTHINTEEECGGYIKPRNWDDKFGLIDDYSDRAKEQTTAVIEGVGQDAEIVTNEKGGKQSKSPMAMHLVDPIYLYNLATNKAEELEYEDEGESTCVDDEDREAYSCYKAIANIALFMKNNDKLYLQWAMDCLDCDEITQVISIAKVLQYGAGRYSPNNWRLIPEEEHINHALIHLVAHLAGDTQDNHIDHALCRLMMANATDRSKKFNYGVYVG